MNNKHENYELLNLIGYGLAKFDMNFVQEFGYKTKTSFYQYIVKLAIAETIGTVKNRQDLFDPFFENDRKGWWQKGNTYIHRKILIDTLFGNLDAVQFAWVVSLYIESESGILENPLTISPVMRSKFKQLQLTGQEAEIYFLNNYQNIPVFRNGILDDARLFGDGYDFQIQVDKKYFLAEIKGVRLLSGSIRLTENEFLKASEYKDKYGLIIISNLEKTPKVTAIFNPINKLSLARKVVTQNQITYHSNYMLW